MFQPKLIFFQAGHFSQEIRDLELKLWPNGCFMIVAMGQWLWSETDKSSTR